MVGRPWAFALAAGGSRGVGALLSTMLAELQTAMALTGCTDVVRANRDLLAV
jgi:L-lactate dehydrogenase (cytochrome)